MFHAIVNYFIGFRPNQGIHACLNDKYWFNVGKNIIFTSFCAKSMPRIAYKISNFAHRLFNFKFINTTTA